VPEAGQVLRIGIVIFFDHLIVAGLFKIPNFDDVVAGSEADLISRRILGDSPDGHRLITHDSKPGGRLVAMLHQIESRRRRQWKWNFRAVLASRHIAVTAAVQQAADPPQAKSD